MNLFGCKFCKMDENWLGQPIKRCERKNFDSLLWALTTVFQVNLHGLIKPILNWFCEVFLLFLLPPFACVLCAFPFSFQMPTFATFFFVHSLLGMLLFGCTFCSRPETEGGARCTIAEINLSRAGNGDCECARANYDSFLSAFLTVFQVSAKQLGRANNLSLFVVLLDYHYFLNQSPFQLQILTCEDWNMVLFNGMAQTTPWAALYFVALMTFGNYVLFNLLVAILVEGFQESKEEEKRQLVRFNSAGIDLAAKFRKKKRDAAQKRKNGNEKLNSNCSSPKQHRPLSCNARNAVAVRAICRLFVNSLSRGFRWKAEKKCGNIRESHLRRRNCRRN